MLEIAVGGGDAALARLAAIAVAAGAHRTARLAPEEPGVAEHAIEPGRLGLALHAGRARHHHGDHALGHAPAAHHVGGGLQIRQAGVGAGADEHALHRQPGQRHPRPQPHVGQRAFDRAAPAFFALRRIGHAVGDAEHLARVGAPGDLRLERAAVEHDLAIECGAVVGRKRAPSAQRAVP